MTKARSLDLAVLLAVACGQSETAPEGSTGELDATADASTNDAPGTEGTEAGGPTTDAEASTGAADTGPPPPACGDGVVDDAEQCDLGPSNGTGTYCTGDCTNNVCGDGYLGPGELCDDGNTTDGDACTVGCTLASCGDGIVQPGEPCDEGEDNLETGACLPSCTAATCGDLFVQAGVEVCNGSSVAEATCATEGFDGGVLLCNVECSGFDTSGCQRCGDGIAEGDEDCDGLDLGGRTCSSQGGTGGTLSCDRRCRLDTSGCVW